VKTAFAFLLEDCFWSHLDTGSFSEQTPLLTGIFEGHPLAEVLCLRFGISPEEAEFEIEAARREVML
jgi:hypothetical protein